jgi:hypothetical protein
VVEEEEEEEERGSISVSSHTSLISSTHAMPILPASRPHNMINDVQ